LKKIRLTTINLLKRRRRELIEEIEAVEMVVVMAKGEVIEIEATGVVLNLGEKTRMALLLKQETSLSQEAEAEEVAEVDTEAASVEAKEEIEEIVEVKEGNSAATGVTDEAEIDPRRKVLLNLLSNNSNHNNEY
jgi:hypothetical protein